jgi:hypothetical protein
MIKMDIDKPEQDQRFSDKVYYSKRDAWITFILWAIITFGTVSAVVVTFSFTSILRLLTLEVLFLGLVAFCLSILRSTYYTLTSDSLRVRSGPFRWTIRLDTIDEIIPARNLYSSAALSLDRLHVRQRGSRSSTYISPEDKELFLQELADRSPDLVFSVDRVIRAGPATLETPL